MDQKLSYRMIQVGRAPAGLLGLNELFTALFDSGVAPDDPGLVDALVEGVRANNFIPKSAVGDYQDALKRDYKNFYQKKLDDGTFQGRTYGSWRGYPREQISWFPTISMDRCIDCDRCVDFCSYGVYKKQPDGKVAMVEPFLCLVGCQSCASICEPHAILFPPREILDNYRPLG